MWSADQCDALNKATSREEAGKARKPRFGFVNLEKAFDTVTRKMAMDTLRWMEAPEARMVEAMYESSSSSSIRYVE